MIVSIEYESGVRQFLVPPEWQDHVVSLLMHIDEHAMGGNGQTVVPTLLTRGNRPICAMKVIREYYGVSIKEAKRIVDLAPTKLPPLHPIRAKNLIDALDREASAVAAMPSAIERLGALAKHEVAAAKAIAALNGE